MLASTAWIWHTSAWITAAAASLLLLWGFFQNRSRGRKRCPKCWYALDDVPKESDGWRCPECGRLTTREKRLHRTRRRWWTLFPAAIILLGTYFLWATPRAQREGWTGFVPTTVLVLGVEHLDSTSIRYFPGLSAPLGGRAEPPPPPAPPKSRRQRLHDALVTRLSQSEVWEWQSRVLAARIERGDSRRRAGTHSWMASYSAMLRAGLRSAAPGSRGHAAFIRTLRRGEFVVRERYHSRAPVFAQWRPSHDALLGFDIVAQLWVGTGASDERRLIGGNGNVSFTRAWQDHVVRLADGPERFSGAVDVRYYQVGALDGPVSKVLLEQTRVRLPIRVVRDEQEALPPIASEAFRDVLSRHLNPSLRLNRLSLFAAHEYGDLPDEVRNELGRIRGTTVALRVEVMADDVAVSSSVVWWRASDVEPDWVRVEPSFWCDLFITQEEITLIRRAAREGPLTLRLTGDPIVALRDMESTHYWQGLIEVPFVP